MSQAGSPTPALRPEPGRGHSGRAPFFTRASLAVEGPVLVVTDEDGVRHRFARGDRPGQVDRLGIVDSFGLLGGFGTEVRGARSWLVALDRTGTALVASDLEHWDREEVRVWWGLLHGGQLEIFITKPGAPGADLPRAVETTLLLQPTTGTGLAARGVAWVAAVLFVLVPMVSGLPRWLGFAPLAVLVSSWVIAGEVRGRRRARHRADRMAALDAALPASGSGKDTSP